MGQRKRKTRRKKRGNMATFLRAMHDRRQTIFHSCSSGQPRALSIPKASEKKCRLTRKRNPQAHASFPRIDARSTMTARDRDRHDGKTTHRTHPNGADPPPPQRERETHPSQEKTGPQRSAGCGNDRRSNPPPNLPWRHGKCQEQSAPGSADRIVPLAARVARSTPAATPQPAGGSTGLLRLPPPSSVSLPSRPPSRRAPGVRTTASPSSASHPAITQASWQGHGPRGACGGGDSRCGRLEPGPRRIRCRGAEGGRQRRRGPSAAHTRHVPCKSDCVRAGEGKGPGGARRVACRAPARRRPGLAWARGGSVFPPRDEPGARAPCEEGDSTEETGGRAWEVRAAGDGRKGTPGGVSVGGTGAMA